jgi:hypothetical protein
MPGRSYINGDDNQTYQYSGKELDKENLLTSFPFTVKAISKGIHDGDYAAVYIDGDLVSGRGLYQRGFTLVVINEEGEIFEGRYFDTYSSDTEANEMVQYLYNKVPDGYYVIGVVCDEASVNMTEEAYSLMEEYLGLTKIRNVGFDDSYVFIAKMGGDFAIKEKIVKRNKGFAEIEIGKTQPLACRSGAEIPMFCVSGEPGTMMRRLGGG